MKDLSSSLSLRVTGPSRLGIFRSLRVWASGRLRVFLALARICAAVCLAWGLGMPSALSQQPAKSDLPGKPSEAAIKAVEADWAMQDQARIASLLATPEAGPRGQYDLDVPKCPPPATDGHPGGLTWKPAVTLWEAQADYRPVIRACHDGRRLYIGLILPTEMEAKYRLPAFGLAVDAAGAVDGVKNGAYGFHTGQEIGPWWQVDLGASQPIARVVIYNRQDYQPGLRLADNLVVLTSDDLKQWTLRYSNDGKPFGGVKEGRPLEVTFKGDPVRARYVRLQIKRPDPVYLHLDEVEIYGPADGARNIAMKQPASQSSLSSWSRGMQNGEPLVRFGRFEVAFAADSSAAVTINKTLATAEQAKVLREGNRTFVTLALPIAEAGQPVNETLSTTSRAAHLLYATDWQVRSQAGAALGFGKNRLTVEFSGPAKLDPPVELEVQSLALPRAGTVRQSIMKKTLDKPGVFAVEFQIAQEGGAGVFVVARQGGGQARIQPVATFIVPPIQETLTRAARLAEDQNLPVPPAVQGLRTQASALEQQEVLNGPQPQAREELCRQARWLARQVAFASPLVKFDRLVFVKRFTQETYTDICLNHLPWVSRPGGDICVLSPVSPDGQVRNVINGALGPGHVHGMDLWYDADRIVFGYARSKTDQPPTGWLDRANTYELHKTAEPTHIFEIGLDGTGVRQLTSGQWSDLDPTYLPSGEIAFASERCGSSLQCNGYDNDETSCNLYAMKPDGSKIHRLSASKDGDYMPHTFDDGTIGYTRWEYQERGWANIQSIWYMRPDGTGADALYKQHMNNPWALEDTRSIPGADNKKLVSIAAGHHTLAEGPVVVIDPTRGINNPLGIGIVTPGVQPPEGGMDGVVVPEGGVLDAGGTYMTPWPLSEKHFLASYCYAGQAHNTGFGLYLIDVYGTKELIYRDDKISCFIPMPLRQRTKPPVLAEQTDPTRNYATCNVSTIGVGSESIPPGTVKYLRIAQGVGWPYDNKYGGHRYEPDGNWTPTRILGTVPVQPDGSVSFVVPPDQAFYFQLLDANMMEVRRMRSFISFQPGENRSCVGCHETRALVPVSGSLPTALRDKPSIPVPPPWGSERPISFLADVQPVLDRNCVQCHSGTKPAGGMDFYGGLTARHNRAYDTIDLGGLVERSPMGDDAKITQPMAFGSHKSRIIAVLTDVNHSKRLKLTQDDRLRLVTWVDANAAYHHSFINKRPEVPPYDLPADTALLGQIKEVNTRRCVACHNAQDISRLDWIDIRQPDKSLFLAAPLMGANGKCKGVYKNVNDADYQALLKVVREAVKKAWEKPRRDLTALKP